MAVVLDGGNRVGAGPIFIYNRCMPVEPDLYRVVMGRFATGVAVITARAPEGPVGMTANAVCSLSLEPLALLVCFENVSRTLPLIRAAGRFGVNVLAADQSQLSARFASKRLAEREKFDGVAHAIHAEVPVIDGVIAWLVCDLRDMYPAGDHTVGIGGVVDMGHRNEMDPLVWLDGRYTTVAAGEVAPR